MSKPVQNIVSRTPTATRRRAVQFDLTTARIIATNAIQNLTEAGIPTATPPVLALWPGQRRTDKALRLVGRGEVNEIQFAPWNCPDLDKTAAITIRLRCAKSANANTVTVGRRRFFGVGDTNAGAIPARSPRREATTMSFLPRRMFRRRWSAHRDADSIRSRRRCALSV